MSIKSNTAWNLAGNGLPFLLGVVTIPYLLNHIGVEAFGILTLIWALIGYFSLFDFGLGRALTQQIATSRLSGSENGLPQLVKTGLLFTALTGFFGGFILVSFAKPLASHWLKVSSSLQTETMQCLIISGLGIPLATISTGLKGVLEGYEDFKSVNYIRTGLGLASFGLPVLTVMFINSSLVWMVASLVITRLVVLVAHLSCVNKKLPPSWWQSKSSTRDIKKLFSFGVWMTSSNIIGPLMVTADRFIISAILGASTVAYYTVPFDALMRILIIPTALSVALFPRLASHFSCDLDKANELYVRSIKTVALVLAPICFVIALSSYWGLSLWLGHAFAEESWLIVSILSVGVFFNGIAFVPLAAIQATGCAKKTAILHIVEFALYVPLLLLALHFFGIIGAAILWVIRVGADLMGLMMLAKNIFSANEINVINSQN